MGKKIKANKIRLVFCSNEPFFRFAIEKNEEFYVLENLNKIKDAQGFIYQKNRYDQFYQSAEPFFKDDICHIFDCDYDNTFLEIYDFKHKNAENFALKATLSEISGMFGKIKLKNFDYISLDTLNIFKKFFNKIYQKNIKKMCKNEEKT